jgi:hypothetical protein
VRTRRALLALAAGSALLACGDVKEWQEQSGTLTLRARPLPAVEGMPLALSVEGSNVGPVSVYQGDSLIATFANVALDGKQSYTVSAVSDEAPHAEAVAYDFRRVRADASELVGEPEPAGNAGSAAGGTGAGGSGGTAGDGMGGTAGSDTGGGGMSGSGGTPAVNDCPGMIAGSVCSHPLGAFVQVTLFNQRDGDLAVFRRTPLPQPCVDEAVGTIASGSSLTLPNVEVGVSLVVRGASSGDEIKWFEVPNTPHCVLVL